MAATRDTTVTAGRSRTAGSGIIVTGDRSVGRQVARRHSKIVSTLRIALPLGALAAAGVFGLSVMRTTGWGSKLPEIAMPQILPESLKMDNPHYEGFNADGGRYWIKAATARQDLKALHVIALDAISGELIDAEKQSTKLTAKRGTFDNKANLLELFDAIDVSGDGGLRATLTRATIRTKEGLISSDQPVTVEMSAGRIAAQQMKIRQKAKEYTFSDGVRTNLNPPSNTRAPAPTAADDKQSPLAFGDPGQPIDVASSRLDINDSKKTAVFTGEVVAVQGNATMTTPEMTVVYTGEVQGKSGAKDDDGGRVKSIIAQDPVVLKRTNGATLSGRSAQFDAVARTAAIEGDIVMTQEPDKRAVGDRAEFDETSNSVMLTGAVVVTQGANELKGRKLVINRATGKMQLTGSGAGAAGRVAARFQQSGRKPQPAKEARTSGAGISFGAAFRTDPNAPVQIEADRLDVDDAAKKATFTGDVRAKQGDFFIRSAELVAGYSGSASLGAESANTPKAQAAELTHINAKKNVEITSQNGQKATGDWAEFDTKANIATLGGDVVLSQGNNVVRGTKLVIDMNTGETTIRNDGKGTGAKISSSDGTDNGGAQSASRPSAVFYPNEIKGQPAKSKRDSGPDGWQARTGP